VPRDLVLVTASLRPDGGGTALVARLLARVAAEFAAEAGVEFRILDLESASPLPIATTPRHFGGSQARLAAAVIREQLGSEKPALIFDHLGPARIQSLLPATLRSPYLVFLHGVEVWRRLSFGRRRALLGATALLANSNFTAARAEAINPGLGRIQVVPLALEERPPEGVVDETVLARAGRDFVLTVGRLHPAERYKGHDELLAAWPQISREHPGARWVVAGTGDDLPRLRAEAKKLGVAASVVFTGFVSEATLAELYARCAVFALPSHGEGFGLVYLEAMRAGKPCIALAGTAAAEVIVDGETGLLLREGTVEGLSDAVLSLLKEPHRATEFGRASAARFETQYRFDRFRDQLARHLQHLV
jgi:phosphatidyl-myo-inositol dimannoside synthase